MVMTFDLLLFDYHGYYCIKRNILLSRRNNYYKNSTRQRWRVCTLL